MPVPAGPMRRRCRSVTIQLPIYNEMYVADRLIDAVCQIDYPRELLEIQVLDDSTDETRGGRRAGRAAQRRQGHRHHLPPPHRPHRLQGRRARGRHEGGQGRVHRHLRRRLHPRAPTSCGARCPTSPIPKIAMVQARWGHINAGLLAAHQDPVDPARRALRARARRPQPRGPLLQLQRHGRHLAARRRSSTPAAGSTTR